MSMAALRWARAVRGITAAQKAALLLLADMANEDGECWPSVVGLADDACLSERGARDCLRAIEAAGLMTRIEGGGRHRTTLYRLRVCEPETRQQMPPYRPANSAAGSAIPANAAPFDTQETRQMPTETRQHVPERGQLVPERGQHLPPNPKEPSLTLKEPSTRARFDADAFEAWWRHYPRKVGKDAARTAYAAALKRGATDATLAVALQRQRWPAEQRFIPHARTWLTQGRWQDDPDAAAPADPGPRNAINRQLDWMAEVAAELAETTDR